MATTLIVLAHPDRRSFNGTWAKATESASKALGHEVIWSDLCAMQFDPVEGASHYSGIDIDAPFDVLRAQEAASAAKMLPADVMREIEKIRQADRIVLHFPLWWFSPPAILKGWCDRVLVHGALHSVDARFDRGLCRGKRALFCVTTGSSAAESAYNGKEGDVRLLLWPLAYTMRYLGMTVLEPKIIHGVHAYHGDQAQHGLEARLTGEIDRHAQTIAAFDTRDIIPFNPDSDFDEGGSLRPDATSYSHFIRRAP